MSNTYEIKNIGIVSIVENNPGEFFGILTLMDDVGFLLVKGISFDDVHIKLNDLCLIKFNHKIHRMTGRMVEMKCMTLHYN